MSKFDIQGNPNDKFVLNLKKSSYYSVNKRVWSNDKELLRKMARLLVMENYQTVYIDATNEDLMYYKTGRRGKHFEIFRNSKNERLQ